MNEIIAETKKGSAGRAYATLKKKQQALLDPYTKLFGDLVFTSATVKVIWTEPIKGKLRDPDNISAGVKFLLDALVLSGVLVDDSWKVINSITHEFKRDEERTVKLTLLGEIK